MISIANIPETTTAATYVKNIYNINHDFPSIVNGKVFIFKLKNDFSEIKTDIENKFAHKWFGFANVYDSEQLNRIKNYGGFGLTYNPNYYHSVEDIHAQVFGYPRQNLPKELFEGIQGIDFYKNLLNSGLEKHFLYNILPKGEVHIKKWLIENNLLKKEDFKRISFDNIQKQQSLIKKNTYTDSWGFRLRTPFSYYGKINKYMNLFYRSFIRSRVAEQKSMTQIEQEKMWHRDDDWLFEFRVLFCVKSNKDYGLLVEGIEKPICFEEGHIYIWNTKLLHCPVILDANTKNTRINLITAINPWFDYNQTMDLWQINEYFMNKHPIDMFFENKIFNVNELDLKEIKF